MPPADIQSDSMKRICELRYVCDVIMIVTCVFRQPDEICHVTGECQAIVNIINPVFYAGEMYGIPFRTAFRTA